MRGRGGLTRYVAVQRGGWFQNPSELAADHEPERLVGHYVVASGPMVAPASWPRRELAGWTLRHDRDLPAFDLREAGGGPIGWILGHPVDIAARRIVTEDLVVPAARGAASFERRFQDWLWIGPITLGNPGAFTTTIYRFASRAILDAISGLPCDYRGGDRLRRDVVASRWPELGAVRINHIQHTRRLAAKAQRVALLPGAAVRRVRRRRLQP